MAQSWNILVGDGRLGSLVAAALLAETQHIIGLFVHDHRPDSPHRWACFQKQAAHFNITRIETITLPSAGASNSQSALPASWRSDLPGLSAAVWLSERIGGARIVWPTQIGEDFQQIADVTETALMLGRSGDEQTQIIIETPLVELIDRKLIEVGHQLEVPWELARSCQEASATPCGQCEGCRQRRLAFAQAALEDPLSSAQVAAAS